MNCNFHNMFTYESVNPGDGTSINLSYNDCTMLRDCDKLKSGSKVAVIAVSYTLFAWNEHCATAAKFSDVAATNVADYSTSSVEFTTEIISRKEVVKTIKNQNAGSIAAASAKKVPKKKTATGKKSVKRAIKKPKQKKKAAKTKKPTKPMAKTINAGEKS